MNYESLGIVSTSELVDQAINDADKDLLLETTSARSYGSLAGHIRHQFQINKDARRSSGVEDEIFASLNAYNSKYSASDLAMIGSGSKIFMGLTATKCRAAISWIRDILISAKYKPWSLSPTPSPDLPREVIALIEDALNKEFEDLIEMEAVEPEEQGELTDAPVGTGKGRPGGKPKIPTAKEAQRTIHEINQNKRDLKDAFSEEIFNQAKYELKKIEVQIEDQLAEGKWDSSFSTYIEDFCVFPAAIMKAPVITKTNGLTWKNGKAVKVPKYVYLNKRVAPIDMYPSPDATEVKDGNNCEHIRLSRGELYSLKGVDFYDDVAITRVLEDSKMGSVSNLFLDTGIEGEKADSEDRGPEHEANRDILHGIHYFGSAPASTLREWGMSEDELGFAEDTAELEIEAILVENEIIKCCLNDDPLLRRPYYKSSWQNKPGSWWGRSLPNMMSDNQRMCNAAARSLANNMGYSAGPQMEVYIDRLADSGAIDESYPGKIWQMTSDPTGAGGRAITWHNIPSNAAELIAVYKEFEARADDVTGIPRYAYGNEKVTGTLTGPALAMMLETSSKIIKDAIRNIDAGLIKPRIEYQFYWNMLSNNVEYTGDMNVIPVGSAALVVHGSEQLRRNEFLSLTSNPTDLQIIGMEGRAGLLREMAKDLNFNENPVPSRLVIKKKEEEVKEQQMQQQQAEEQKGNKSVEATTIQIEGQKAMHQGTLQAKQTDQQLRKEKQDTEAQLTAAKLQITRENADKGSAARVEATRLAADQKDLSNRRETALKLKVGSGI